MTAPTARAAKRQIVGELLARNVLIVQGRVFQARVWPIQQTELPALLVFGWQETKTRRSLDMWTHQFEVLCSIGIEGRVQGVDGPTLETNMEILAGQIEAAILTAPELLGLNGTIERIDRVETKLEAHRDAEALQGSVSMSFDLVWTEVHQVNASGGDVTTNVGIVPALLAKA